MSSQQDRNIIKSSALINILDITMQEIKDLHGQINELVDAMHKKAIDSANFVEQLKILKSLPAQQEADFKRVLRMLEGSDMPQDDKKQSEIAIDEEEAAHDRLVERMRQAHISSAAVQSSTVAS